MATNYTLHKKLGELYRASGYQGAYRDWLKSIGYTQGTRAAGAIAEAMRRAEAQAAAARAASSGCRR